MNRQLLVFAENYFSLLIFPLFCWLHSFKLKLSISWMKEGFFFLLSTWWQFWPFSSTWGGSMFIFMRLVSVVNLLLQVLLRSIFQQPKTCLLRWPCTAAMLYVTNAVIAFSLLPHFAKKNYIPLCWSGSWTLSCFVPIFPMFVFYLEMEQGCLSVTLYIGVFWRLSCLCLRIGQGTKFYCNYRSHLPLWGIEMWKVRQQTAKERENCWQNSNKLKWTHFMMCKRNVPMEEH